MIFTIVFATLALAAPIEKREPSLQEMMLAHTSASELARVHSANGLRDVNLFMSAHSATAPNPPNAAAAGGTGPIARTPPNGGATMNTAQLLQAIQAAGGLKTVVPQIGQAIATCRGGACQNGNPAGTPQIAAAT